MTYSPPEPFPSQPGDAAMRDLVMNLFCDVLHRSGLPPMDVLEQAAEALGAVYRDVAEAHAHPAGCPCGWRPEELRDIGTLQSALARCALTQQQHYLALVAPVGQA